MKLSSASISYGTDLPTNTLSADGALFYKTASQAGLYIHSTVIDTNTTSFGNQVARAWVPVISPSTTWAGIGTGAAGPGLNTAIASFLSTPSVGFDTYARPSLFYLNGDPFGSTFQPDLVPAQMPTYSISAIETRTTLGPNQIGITVVGLDHSLQIMATNQPFGPTFGPIAPTSLRFRVQDGPNAWTPFQEIWDRGNLTNLSQLANGPGYITAAGVAPGVPPGAISYFAMFAPPTGWLVANGAEISRTTFANLFAAIGTVYGFGDGTTTFNIPDLRGLFLRSLDEGRGIDPGRPWASVQQDGIRDHTHYRNQSQVSEEFFIATVTFGASTGGAIAGSASTSSLVGGPIESGSAPETRPTNTALRLCIKF